MNHSKTLLDVHGLRFGAIVLVFAASAGAAVAAEDSGTGGYEVQTPSSVSESAPWRTVQQPRDDQGIASARQAVRSQQNAGATGQVTSRTHRFETPWPASHSAIVGD